MVYLFLFRAEALYTHGDNDAARILAVKLAEEMINKPEQFIKEAKFEKVSIISSWCPDA